MMYHKFSYSRRLFLWLIGYSLLLVGAFLTFQYSREKEFKAEEINSQLQLINTYILHELEQGKSLAEIDLDELSPYPDLRVSVISDRGEVVSDNTLDTIHASNHLNRKEIQEALHHTTGFAVRRHSQSTGDTYFYSARRGDSGLIVRTAVPYSLSLSSFLEADFGFLWVMSGITLIMCVAGFFATRRLGRTIKRLSRFAERAEQGEQIADTAPFSHDELGDISNHIVHLYARLQSVIAQRDREHHAALHEQKEKERIKKQLTNNINHELKTPVAAVKVCLETLLAHKDMDAGRREEFLRRSLANTSRLERLMADVALITRMDDGGSAIVREPVNLTHIIAEVVDDHIPVADAHGLLIRNEVSREIIMQGNLSLLASVFNNLIDNAIAYSGGSLVTIRELGCEAGMVTIEVADNGTGVPEEHLPRITERFYRVDKGRSRAAGGTGLGLAIVKNTLMIHGGTITLENCPQGGLRALLRMPIAQASS